LFLDPLFLDPLLLDRLLLDPLLLDPRRDREPLLITGVDRNRRAERQCAVRAERQCAVRAERQCAVREADCLYDEALSNRRR